MIQDKKRYKVLVFNYSFPPNEGIGGRRWAKFCKYLFKAEIDFIVICKKTNKNNKTSNWSNDVEGFKSKINFIDFKYPSVLENISFTFKEKIAYRLALRKVKRSTLGNYYDRSSCSQTETKNLIRNLIIEEKITTVIVSVAPFGFAHIIGELKNEFKEVQFIVDFRDPWIDNRTAYGMESMSIERQQYEIEAEKSVVKNFDAVVSVSEVMSKNFQNRYPAIPKNKFHTIPNGFDKDDISNVTNVKANDKINIVFIGTFYPKANHHLDNFIAQLIYIKENDPTTFKKMAINFYGTQPFKVNAISDAVTFHERVSVASISKVLNFSDIGLLFLTDDINYSFSTKFCEYIAHKLPIIVFSKQGKTGDFVEENGIGIEINSASDQSKMLNFIKSYDVYEKKVKTFDTKNFDVEHLTESYVNLF